MQGLRRGGTIESGPWPLHHRAKGRRAAHPMPEEGRAMSVAMRTVCRLLWCMILPPAVAQAQTFPLPGKPLRIVVPFPACGTTDIHARHVAARLGPLLGTSVIVDNKSGGSTIIGAMDVVKAPADGHTILY